ncbi:hypothetical protein O181_014136, partial [Austropuccinia psidii MF-1]|nr:hypothetical protein [Austropuccinia psidii MF-1]
MFTQGVAYGVGGSMIYTTAVIYLAEWWIKRRGFVSGLTFSGSAITGLLFAPLMEWSLRKHGTMFTMRAYAIGWACLMIPLLPFLKGRLPRGHNAVEKANLQNINMPLLIFLVLFNSLHS